MKLTLYQIDAFTDRLFGGNPACVVPLEEWLPDELLLKIAQENAVAETAYFVPDRGDGGGNSYALRWFTPEIEMDLCGHATLATAHAIKTILNHPSEQFVFHSRSGDLGVTVQDGLYTLKFPSRKPSPASLPDLIRQSLDRQPLFVLKARDYMLVYASEEDIRNIKINRQLLDQINLDPGGIIITAKGRYCDFVSRFFTPQASIFEDPVTGSAHCSLIPYWSEQLGKKEMEALQLSDRIGKLYCVDQGESVLIAGRAKTYSIGEFRTE
ncbi:MAG TPA: PhzF family phenazine biosynthesis protein [Puia sp.]|nr:PhzF family phenazine biosynthesis protein [Puia sp.]